MDTMWVEHALTLSFNHQKLYYAQNLSQIADFYHNFMTVANDYQLKLIKNATILFI